MQSCDTLDSYFAFILTCLSPCFSCPRNREFLQKSGLSPYELDTALRAEMNSGGVSASLSLSALLGGDVTRFGEQDTAGPTGGYPWSCGGEEAISKFVPIFDRCFTGPICTLCGFVLIVVAYRCIAISGILNRRR